MLVNLRCKKREVGIELSSGQRIFFLSDIIQSGLAGMVQRTISMQGSGPTPTVLCRRPSRLDIELRLHGPGAAEHRRFHAPTGTCASRRTCFMCPRSVDRLGGRCPCMQVPPPGQDAKYGSRPRAGWLNGLTSHPSIPPAVYHSHASQPTVSTYSRVV
jgi:hypothetical protein